MHRRMSLGLGLVLLLVFLAGAAPASAEPRSASEVSAVGTMDLLDRAWEWLVSLVTSGSTSIPGGAPLDGLDGGAFIDPNGTSGNS